MTRNELKAIIADVLEINTSELNAEVKLEDIESYDSVNALNLMVALSESANVQMNHMDLEGFVTYGDIEAFVISKGVALS